MDQRKILIEVSQEEYQRVLAGALEPPKENDKEIVEEQGGYQKPISLSQIDTFELIDEIRKRIPKEQVCLIPKKPPLDGSEPDKQIGWFEFNFMPENNDKLYFAFTLTNKKEMIQDYINEIGG